MNVTLTPLVTGAPDHQRMYFTAASAQSGGPNDSPRPREYLPSRCYAVLKEQQKLLEQTLSDSSQLSPQHLISVLRQMQAGTSSLMVTETDTVQQQQNDFENDAYHADYDEGTDDDEVSSDALTANLEPPADSDDDDDEMTPTQ